MHFILINSQSLICITFAIETKKKMPPTADPINCRSDHAELKNYWIDIGLERFMLVVAIYYMYSMHASTPAYVNQMPEKYDYFKDIWLRETKQINYLSFEKRSVRLSLV